MPLYKNWYEGSAESEKSAVDLEKRKKRTRLILKWAGIFIAGALAVMLTGFIGFKLFRFVTAHKKIKVNGTEFLVYRYQGIYNDAESVGGFLVTNISLNIKGTTYTQLPNTEILFYNNDGEIFPELLTPISNVIIRQLPVQGKRWSIEFCPESEASNQLFTANRAESFMGFAGGQRLYFYRNGHVSRGVLSKDLQYSTIFFAAWHDITFYENGKVKSGTLASLFEQGGKLYLPYADPQNVSSNPQIIKFDQKGRIIEGVYQTNSHWTALHWAVFYSDTNYVIEYIRKGLISTL